MEDKDVVELKDLKDYVNNKWSIWYSPKEIMHEAPLGAPDWVKKAWVPVPFNNGYIIQSTNSYDCSPNGIVLEGGPQAGTIKPHYPGKGGNSSSLMAQDTYGDLVGIYELKKQSWNYQGLHYHRLVYLFKPNSPKLKLKEFTKKKVPAPNPYKAHSPHEHYEMTKHAEWSGYKVELENEMEYSKPDKQIELEYHKDQALKYYKPNTSYSSGTHTGTISFALNDVSPEMMNVLYGAQPNLEPEDPEDVALWDAI